MPRKEDFVTYLTSRCVNVHFRHIIKNFFLKLVSYVFIIQIFKKVWKAFNEKLSTHFNT